LHAITAGMAGTLSYHTLFWYAFIFHSIFPISLAVV
jgi:hypothetical protein